MFMLIIESNKSGRKICFLSTLAALGLNWKMGEKIFEIIFNRVTYTLFTPLAIRPSIFFQKTRYVRHKLCKIASGYDMTDRIEIIWKLSLIESLIPPPSPKSTNLRFFSEKLGMRIAYSNEKVGRSWWWAIIWVR